jgi:succinoglycan biosynthesis protein ExoO
MSQVPEAKTNAHSAVGMIPPAATPDVSYVIAARDVAPFIEEAVLSALGQTGVSVEVIVVDDQSRDETADIVERLARSDRRITLIRQPLSRGPGAARNTAHQYAKGTWIGVLDGDDFIAPGRTRAMLDLAAATSAVIIGDNFERVTMSGKSTGTQMFPAGQQFSFSVDAATFIVANTMFQRRVKPLGAIKVLVRKEFLNGHALAYPEDLPVGEDYRFILDCLLKGGRFVVTAGDGYKYRMRPGSQSWRLNSEHMAKLSKSHEQLLADIGSSGTEDVRTAARAYGVALVRYADFVEVVTFAKAHAWWRAAQKTATSPRAWPLLIFFGSEAVTKRFSKLIRQNSGEAKLGHG